jgi:hypothetical protein
MLPYGVRGTGSPLVMSNWQLGRQPSEVQFQMDLGAEHCQMLGSLLIFYWRLIGSKQGKPSLSRVSSEIDRIDISVVREKGRLLEDHEYDQMWPRRHSTAWCELSNSSRLGRNKQRSGRGGLGGGSAKVGAAERNDKVLAQNARGALFYYYYC